MTSQDKRERFYAVSEAGIEHYRGLAVELLAGPPGQPHEAAVERIAAALAAAELRGARLMEEVDDPVVRALLACPRRCERAVTDDRVHRAFSERRGRLGPAWWERA